MKSPAELSFLPDDYLKNKAGRRANVLCGALTVVVIAAVGSAFTLTERSMQEVEARHLSVEKAYAEAARRIDQVNQMRQQQATIVKQAELASSLVEKIPRSNLLAEFTNALPEGVSLLDLSLEARVRTPVAPPPTNAFDQRRADREAKMGGKPAEAMSEAKHYDVAIRLTGVAGTDIEVAQFISRLNRSPLLRDVNLLITDTFKPDPKDPRELRKFSIEMALNPAAEVGQEPARSKTAAVELAH